MQTGNLWSSHRLRTPGEHIIRYAPWLRGAGAATLTLLATGSSLMPASVSSDETSNKPEDNGIDTLALKELAKHSLVEALNSVGNF